MYDTSLLMQALHAAPLHQPGGNDWFMDSGASSHITSDPGNLPKYDNSLLPSSSHVIVGNGSQIHVLGTGSTFLSSPNLTFSLRHVLHIPDLVKNLISIRQSTPDNTCSIEFYHWGFFVKDLLTKTKTMRSDSDGDLYPFHGTKTHSPKVALLASSLPAVVWHLRLGHQQINPCCI